MSNAAIENEHAREAEPLAAAQGPGANGAMVEVSIGRVSQEVQAAMVIARRFPRDETRAIARIRTACQRKALAEAASYAYPRGGQMVSGPSIRLAEVLAQAWGNIDFGIVEIEQRRGESVVMAYCWDLETNTRQTRVFSVPHTRYTKKGSYPLTDPRDIYEAVANTGARRLRACILGVIPGDVQDLAEKECEKTLSGNGQEPLIDRVRRMLEAFEAIGVNQQMIEGRLGHRAEAALEPELSSLRKIYQSLRDGVGKPEQFFEKGPAAGETAQRAAELLRPASPPAQPAQGQDRRDF